jgi:hypothetical protein
VDAGFNYLRLYTLMMLPGTELADTATRQTYEMQTRFRVLPRCFGEYAFADEPVRSVEVEEVCVATKDLSFADYLECRRLHLTVEIFYNDRIFGELIEFLKLHGVSVFAWLMAIHQQLDRFPDDLRTLYTRFHDETAGELWASREALEAFAKRSEAIRRYVTGELGSNLIFKYKALAIFESARALHEVAYATARELLAGTAPDALARYATYLEELRRFSQCAKLDLMDMGQVVEDRFGWDFEALTGEAFACLPDGFERPDGIVHYFYHDRVQRESLSTHLRQYGRDLNGLARILAKVYVKHLYRKHSTQPPTVELEQGVEPVPAESRLF